MLSYKYKHNLHTLIVNTFKQATVSNFSSQEEYSISAFHLFFYVPNTAKNLHQSYRFPFATAASAKRSEA